MNTKKYEIYKKTVEISYKDRKEIKSGCADAYKKGCSLEFVKGFDMQEEANEFFKMLKSDIKQINKYFLINEYVLECNEFNNNGVLSTDVLDFSKMEIEVVKKPAFETVATFDNYEQAEKIMQELQTNDEELNEYYLSF